MILLLVFVQGCATSYVSFIGQCVLADYRFGGMTVRRKVLCYEDPYYDAYLGFRRMDSMKGIVDPPVKEILNLRSGEGFGAKDDRFYIHDSPEPEKDE